jgi:hypothetical protein
MLFEGKLIATRELPKRVGYPDAMTLTLRLQAAGDGDIGELGELEEKPLVSLLVPVKAIEELLGNYAQWGVPSLEKGMKVYFIAKSILAWDHKLRLSRTPVLKPFGFERASLSLGLPETQPAMLELRFKTRVPEAAAGAEEAVTGLPQAAEEAVLVD